MSAEVTTTVQHMGMTSKNNKDRNNIDNTDNEHVKALQITGLDDHGL